MLTEYLEGIPAPETQWSQVMGGVRACRFSLASSVSSEPPALMLCPLHFEALFCLGGGMTLIRRDREALSLGAGGILLLSDISGLSGVQVDGPIAGILVAVDARNSRESFAALRQLLGCPSLETGRVKQWMERWGGCTLLKDTAWSQAVFSHLYCLPPAEQGRYCVLKSAELLYLLCAREPEAGGSVSAACLDGGVPKAMAETCRYMEEHLDEKLTIAQLSRRTYLSHTAFKACFRRILGQPVHTWLRERRMERAAELLRETSLGVLEIAQAVGYSSTSQFGAAFRQRYGMSPIQYRKMSKSDGF